MPDEIEAKLKVENHDAVREALLAAGATRVSKVREVNTYYACEDPDVGLRTRLETDEAGQTRGRVTYKGPRKASKYKSREEIEFDAGDTEAAGHLLERLGHCVALRFEKDRETFTLGDCEIVLDTLPRLGHFIEVEGPSEASVADVLAQLGLADCDTIQQGYASMLAATGETDVRF